MDMDFKLVGSVLNKDGGPKFQNEFCSLIDESIFCSKDLFISSLCPGNSAVQAISLLIKKGVPESNIIFLNLISVCY